VASLQAVFVSQLPAAVAQSPAWVRFVQVSAEDALMRGCWPVLAELFLEREEAQVSKLAELCHQMRRALPCDLDISQALWGMPPPALADPAEMEALRRAELSDARLPYASSIRALRTLLHARTVREKASVLLHVCELVASAAQHSASMQLAREGGRGACGGRPPALGAEDLLPIMVYVVLRSRAAVLPAELELISELMPAELAFGCEGYALTTMQCACHVLLRTRFCEGIGAGWEAAEAQAEQPQACARHSASSTGGTWEVDVARARPPRNP
jgi:hypothetical protein